MDLLEYLLILLVDASLLPTRKHDNEVQLAKTLLGCALRLHFSQCVHQIIVFVLLTLRNQLEILGLISDDLVHIFVCEHGCLGLTQSLLKTFFLNF